MNKTVCSMVGNSAKVGALKKNSDLKKILFVTFYLSIYIVLKSVEKRIKLEFLKMLLTYRKSDME